MFSSNEIDAVLEDAQSAVETLTGSVDAATGGRGEAVSVSEDTTAEANASAEAIDDLSAPAMPAGQDRRVSERVRRILKVRVPVVVRLVERRMRVNEVLRFAPGTILEFNRNVGDELDLVVGNRVVGKGTAVKLNEHFGMRINRIGDVRERIVSLGS